MRRITARRSPVFTALAVCCLLVLAGCSTVTKGNGSPQREQLAPDVSASSLPIKDDGHTAFDQLVRNSLTDVQQFWTTAYPSLSGGAALKPLAGGIYSVETGKPDLNNACMKAQPKAADNNAFYCRLDDTFAYDRVGLVKIISDKLGENFVPLVFAHEFGHLIQNRLDKSEHASIYLESQADCASGAFMAAETGVGSVKLKNIHFGISPTNLDALMVGMILLRDYSPHSADDSGTHGDGFDRISAFADGFSNGVKYCYSDDWYARKFTERSYASDTDYKAGGNETLAQVTNPAPATSTGGGGGLQPSLNAFWARAFKTINKTFKPVSIKQAASPPCGPKGSQFNYCASDNTVYFSADFASSAYYSVPVLVQDPTTKIVSIKQNSAADYALGAMFAYGWGVAVRSQLGLSTSTAAGLIGASCYVGAYSKTINLATSTSAFTLSPPDMDEATVAVLRIVGQDTALGDRNTTGFQRISAFKKGYFGSLTVC
jgi:predicted metalloprotease